MSSINVIHKIIGFTIESVEDISSEFTESYRLNFTNGEYLEISGHASGGEIEYDGLFLDGSLLEDSQENEK